ncbi:hypothetical protein C9374_004387 [Naegleria lovaniensis]|uniref:Uncharacterized protein n=1 Tax=Naegleria lovaniensis TaxID=51637 RepID=A0AA88GMH7_NAELO|nr:uncharacterized protein C9374_004387 [Naegleria lovaniensis]KAG2383716.1 hypothetical protein C9374_004387 [Naegleria lovaniensis]
MKSSKRSISRHVVTLNNESSTGGYSQVGTSLDAIRNRIQCGFMCKWNESKVFLYNTPTSVHLKKIALSSWTGEELRTFLTQKSLLRILNNISSETQLSQIFTTDKTQSLYDCLKDLLEYCYCSRSRVSIFQNLHKLSTCCSQALVTQQQARGPSMMMDDEYEMIIHSHVVQPVIMNHQTDIRTTIQQVSVQNLMKIFLELSQMDAVELVSALQEMLMQCPLESQ